MDVIPTLDSTSRPSPTTKILSRLTKPRKPLNYIHYPYSTLLLPLRSFHLALCTSSRELQCPIYAVDSGRDSPFTKLQVETNVPFIRQNNIDRSASILISYRHSNYSRMSSTKRFVYHHERINLSKTPTQLLQRMSPNVKLIMDANSKPRTTALSTGILSTCTWDQIKR